MSDNKHYYYIKLKADYFDTDEMIVLESMPDGYKYSNILLKFILRSLRNEGKLMFNNKIPFNSVMLSQVTRHSVGDIEKAVKLFQDLNLIEILENGDINIFSYPTLSNDDGDIMKPIFGLDGNGKIVILMKKDILKNKLLLNVDNPGMWAII